MPKQTPWGGGGGALRRSLAFFPTPGRHGPPYLSLTYGPKPPPKNWTLVMAIPREHKATESCFIADY